MEQHDQSSPPPDGTPAPDLPRSKIKLGWSVTGNAPYWWAELVAGEEHLIDELTDAVIAVDRRLSEYADERYGKAADNG